MNALLAVFLLASSAACALAQNEVMLAEVPVGNPTHRVTAVPSATLDGTFMIRWTWNIDTGASTNLITDTAYIGVGFQNGVTATTPSGSLTMFGPMGTDYFIVRGVPATPSAEYRTLAAGGSGTGTRPVRQATFSPPGMASNPDDRIQGFTTVQGRDVVYEVRVRCQAASGQTGYVNFTEPVSVLWAYGGYTSNEIQYHSTNRGRRQVAGGNLDILTLCGAPATSTAPATAATTPMSETVLAELPSSSSPTLRVTAERSAQEDAAFRIRVTRMMSNNLISDTAYFGLGFQNGVAPGATSLTMYGPNGADYFILRGSPSNAVAEFRYLAAGGSGRGTRPMLSQTETLTSNSNVNQRIQNLQVTTRGNQVEYTLLIRCQAASGQQGQVDFSQPVSVLHAWGGYSTDISYHSSNRGRRRTSSNQLELFTLCGSSTAVPTTSSAPRLLTPLHLAVVAVVFAVVYIF